RCAGWCRVFVCLGRDSNRSREEASQTWTCSCAGKILTPQELLRFALNPATQKREDAGILIEDFRFQIGRLSRLPNSFERSEIFNLKSAICKSQTPRSSLFRVTTCAQMIVVSHRVPQTSSYAYGQR